MDVTGLLLELGPLALAAIALIVFVENGLLFPFLPGDSLVFAAGVMAGVLHVSWMVIVVIAAVAAIVGAEVGFAIGRRYGRRMFSPTARVFKTEYLDRTEQFFTRWGRWAIVLARFVPIVRTYISPAAGATAMRRRVFSVWNAISAVVWAGLVGVAGVLLGKIPFVANNIEWITVGIIALTIIPAAIGVLTRRRTASVGGTARAMPSPAADDDEDPAADTARQPRA